MKLSTVVCAFALSLGLTAAVASADTGKIDPVHSSVVFRIKHMNTTNFYGRFNGPTGSITFDDPDQSKNAIEATVQVASISTTNAKRDEDVKGPDYFGAKQFPIITFKSSSLKKVDDTHYEAAGELTLHGVTKPLTVTLEKTGQGQMMGKPITGFQTEFDVKMSDFNIKVRPGALSDDVHLILAMEVDMQS